MMVSAFEPDTDYPIDISLLPKRWLATTVGSVVREVRNGFGTSRHNDAQVGIPHLRPMNITREGKISLGNVKYVEEHKEIYVKRGDIIFNNTNSAELVGKSAVFYLDGEWTFSNHLTRIRLPSAFSAEFVAYQFLHLWREGYFRQRSTQHVNQASINIRTLTETVPLLVAPSAEQARIATELKRRFDRLEGVSLAVEGAQRRLREYKKLVVIAAASGKLVPTEAELARTANRPAEVGRTLLARLMKDFGPHHAPGVAASLFDGVSQAAPGEELEPSQGRFIDLPDGWAWARVEQVGTVKLGRQRSPRHQTGEHMRPYLRVANVFEDYIDTTDVLQMNFTPAEFETYKLEHGDILLNEGQSPELVGRPAMFRDEVPGACFQNTLVRFRAHPGVSPGFALLVFRAYLHLGRFRAIAKWTTNIAHLGARRFAELEFPLPPLVEQERIVAEASRRLDLAQELSVTLGSILERVEAARDLALSQAFTGVLVPGVTEEGDAATLIESLVAEKTAQAPPAPRKGASMPKKSNVGKTARTPLIDVLAAADGPLTPEELLAGSGIGEDLIEEFFAELKRENVAGRITESRDGQGQVHLLAVGQVP